jgi:Ca2+-binding RTX toxin-like protein
LNRLTKLTVPALVAVAGLGAAPAANAVTRYAAPGGSGPIGECPRENPCSIVNAVNGGGVGAGDTVVAMPGTYTLGAELTPNAGLTLLGDPGAPRPQLIATSFDALNLGIGTTARNLYIQGNSVGSGRVVDVIGAGALLEQSEVVGNGNTGITVQVRDGGTVRNSIVRSNATVAFGSAITSGSGGATTQTLHNVTAIAAGTAPSFGIMAPSTFGSIQNLAIVNSIADGNGGAAISATDDGGSDNVRVTVDYSNFPDISVAPPEATIAQGPGNQTGVGWPAPLFFSPVTGDFHQLPGSPTINAGMGGIGGELDVDGQRRSMEGQIDIGADEFPGVCAGMTVTVSGSAANETLTGTSGPDVFVGFGGNDTIKGLGGADIACGGVGRDKLIGGAGNDRLLGEAGRDKLRGGAGKDRLLGGAGRDLLLGGKGKDRLNGGPGRDSQRP